MRRAAAALDDQRVDVDVDADVARARDGLAGVTRDLRGLDGAAASVDVDASTGSARAGLGRIAAAVRDLDGRRARVKVDVDTSGIDRLRAAFKRTDEVAAGLGVGLRQLKLPALVGGLGTAAAAASSLAAGAVALTGALAPLVGLVGAAAPAGIAAGTAIGAVRLATIGLSDAISAGLSGDLDKFSEALEGLPEPAQRLARHIADLRPRLEELRQVAAGPILGSLHDGLRRVEPLFPVLREAVAGAASEIGSFIDRSADLVTSPLFRADLATVAERNTALLGSAGTVALNLGDALRHVAVAAGPLAQFLADTAVRASEMVREFLASSRASGELAGFFDQTRATVERLISIAQNLGTIFVDVLGGGADLGRDLLASFDALTGRAAAFTSSLEGSRAIGDFFERARPVLEQTAGLIGDIVAGFAGLAATPGTAELIGQIRDELLPAVAELFARLSDAGFLSTLVTLATEVLRVFTALADTGAFGLLVEAFTAVAGAVATLLEKVPFLAELVGAFLALASAAAVIGPIFGAIITVVGLVKVALGPVVALLGAVAAALGLPLAPVAAVVAAVVGLAALFVIHFDTIRRVVGDVVGAVVGFLSRPVNFLREQVVPGIAGALASAVGFFAGLPGRVAGALAGFVASIGDRVAAGVAFFRELPGRILGAIGNLRDRLANLGRDIIQGFIDGVRGLAGRVGQVIKDVITAPIDAAKRLLRIGSPSRVARDMGRDVGEGYAMGLEDLARRVNGATRSLVALPADLDLGLARAASLRAGGSGGGLAGAGAGAPVVINASATFNVSGELSDRSRFEMQRMFEEYSRELAGSLVAVRKRR